MKTFGLGLLKKIGLVITTFLLPIKGIILTVGLMILFDTITGIIKAKKIGDKITSRKLSHIVSKMVLYQTAVILFYLIEIYILSDIISMFIDTNLILTKLVAITLILIEAKSVDENITVITGQSFFKRFKEMIKRAKDIKDEFDDIKKDNSGS